jgi:hypothetical protein
MRTQQFGKLETAPVVIPVLSQKLKKLYFQILLFGGEKSGFTRPRPWVNGKTSKYLIVKRSHVAWVTSMFNRSSRKILLQRQLKIQFYDSTGKTNHPH